MINLRMSKNASYNDPFYTLGYQEHLTCDWTVGFVFSWFPNAKMPGSERVKNI